MHEYSFSVCFMCAKSLQWCLTLCNPMDCTLPGFSVHKISQARILEWVAMPFSRGSSPPRDGTHVSLCFLHWQGGSLTLIPPGKPPFSMLLLLLLLSHFSRVRLCVTPSLGFSRQEHWSGCHFLLQCIKKVKSESEVTQPSPTLRDPMDCSLPGSSIHGIFQARVLEWRAIAFSIQHVTRLQITFCPFGVWT